MRLDATSCIASLFVFHVWVATYYFLYSDYSPCALVSVCNCGAGSASLGGGGDVSAFAVFSVGIPTAAKTEQSKELFNACVESQLVLVYASSSFADERVCLRAKLLTLHGESGTSSWEMHTEVDLLHPPSACIARFDVTCIVGHKVLRFLSLLFTMFHYVLTILMRRLHRGLCSLATGVDTSHAGLCSHNL